MDYPESRTDDKPNGECKLAGSILRCEPMEQREQSQACLSYAESRQRKTKCKEEDLSSKFMEHPLNL